MERDAVATAQAREPAVIVPGAGWAAQPGEMEAAREACLIIYLKCSATTAARGVEQGEVRPAAGRGRPARADPALLADREPFYKLADYEVAADVKAAPAVADEVVRLARAHGGW